MGFVFCTLLISASAQHSSSRQVEWDDVRPLHGYLQARGLGPGTFSAYATRTHNENLRRVREGDLDHLVFFLLQSARISRQPSIEPALSARALVESLDPAERRTFLADGDVALARVPDPVRRRIADVLQVLASPGDDLRLQYFRALIDTAFPDPPSRPERLQSEYLRAMRFVYQKEFVAQRSDAPVPSVAELYRSRGLSTDTAIEAAYVVHLGLGVLKGLDPDRRIRRVLIVGPGLDLAPRTALHEDVPPESYQPWTVLDALLSLGLAHSGDVQVVAADINPRVVEHLRRAASRPPVLAVSTELREDAVVSFSSEFTEYLTTFGTGLLGRRPGKAERMDGRLRKQVPVPATAGAALHAERLDIVTERLAAGQFDLVVATNILPYFDDQQLALATANIAAMLAPGGVFLHNEARPVLGDLAGAVGLPFQQSRHAVIARVKGARVPLSDSVFLHRKER